MEEFILKPNLNEKDSSEEEFQKYIRSLQLSPEDLPKKILDVGSGEAHFAKWAKDKRINSNIFSLEPVIETEEKTKSVKGLAENIPFKDETFDLVVSNCSIPNIFLGEYSAEKKVRASLLEMLRVTKPGGEIRLGTVLRVDAYKSQKEIADALDEVLEELPRSSGVKIEQIRLPERDTYEWTKNKQARILLAKAYLIKIYKPKE